MPVAVVEPAHLGERIPVPAGNRRGGRPEESLAHQFGPADSGELDEPHQVHLGECLVAEEPDLVLVGVELDALGAHFGAALQRHPDGVVDVHLVVLDGGCVQRPDFVIPEPGSIRVADQRLQGVFGLADLLFGDDQRLLAGRHLGLRLQDVDGRHGPDFHLHLVVAQQIAREIERLHFHLVVPDREDEVPIGVLDVPEHVEHTALELMTGLALPVLADQDLPPLRVGAEVLEQRLRHLGVQRAPVARIEGGEGAVRGEAVVVELDGIVGAKGK